MSRKLICRFDSIEDFLILKNKISDDLSLESLEYDLDTSKVLKYKKNTKKVGSKDKHDCEINYVGMPEFDSKKIEAFHKIDFYTSKSNEDLKELFEQNITDETQSIWFPKLIAGKNSKYRVVGGSSNHKYPIYVISKGRSDKCTTSKYLTQMEVKHYVVVEPFEYSSYKESVETEFCRVLEMDLSFKDSYDVVKDFGDGKTGPGAVRNFCWQHSIDKGYKFHWVMDDNANEGFHWLYQNNKIKCRTGAFFKAIEDFTERYENIAISGLNYSKFCKEIDKVPPYVLNTRIYSFLLIRNDIPYQWRGRYNEDTDLSLRALKDGWCTVQFNSLLAGKCTTQKIKGGNTDEFYEEEGTLEKSKILEEMHPDVAKVVWKFNRWHHEVDYSGFTQRLKPVQDLTKFPKIDNKNMFIIKTEEDNTNDSKTYLENKYIKLIENYKHPILNIYERD